MNIIIQLLIVYILYKILKEVLNNSLNAIMFILFAVVVFFILGGSSENLSGIFGTIGTFLSKLPTSQFLDAILNLLKSLFDSF